MTTSVQKTQIIASEKSQEKSQGVQTKSQDPKVETKKPRSWEKSQGVVTLVIGVTPA